MKTSKKTYNKSPKIKHPTEGALQVLPEIFQLEDAVGDFMQYWGFKKIHGRIWAHLYTAKTPLDTEELMKRLKVSKGLMSLAMRDLLNHSVIIENGVGKHGTVFYTANEDLQNVIFKVLQQRESKMLTNTKTILEKLVKAKDSELDKSGLDREKLKSALNLTTSAQTVLSFLLSQPECAGSEIFAEFEQGHGNS